MGWVWWAQAWLDTVNTVLGIYHIKTGPNVEIARAHPLATTAATAAGIYYFGPSGLDYFLGEVDCYRDGAKDYHILFAGDAQPILN